MSLRSDIETAINRNSAENGSDTPDHILARFLEASLAAFDLAVRDRDGWHGFKTWPALDERTIGTTTPADRAPGTAEGGAGRG